MFFSVICTLVEEFITNGSKGIALIIPLRTSDLEAFIEESTVESNFIEVLVSSLIPSKNSKLLTVTSFHYRL